MQEFTGRKVFVYYNLHKHLWSVRCEKTKRVILHTNNILLKDTIYKVSEAGRQRVLREKRKNVHAGVKGIIVNYDVIPMISSSLMDSDAITYNPYKYDSFVYKDSEKRIDRSRLTYMDNRKVWEVL